MARPPKQMKNQLLVLSGVCLIVGTIAIVTAVQCARKSKQRLPLPYKAALPFWLRNRMYVATVYPSKEFGLGLILLFGSIAAFAASFFVRS